MINNEKNNSLEEDLALISRYKDTGDKNAVAALFNKYMSLIYGVCMKYLQDAEQSKDVTMDIYEKMTQKLITHKISNPKAWLYTITKNHCLELLRKKTRFLEKEQEAFLMYSESVFRPYNEENIEKELVMLEDCIEDLEQLQKQTIKMFYLEKMTYKEITNQLDIKWDKARSLIQNGRRNLKKCLDKKYETFRNKQ